MTLIEARWPDLRDCFSVTLLGPVDAMVELTPVIGAELEIISKWDGLLKPYILLRFSSSVPLAWLPLPEPFLKRLLEVDYF